MFVDLDVQIPPSRDGTTPKVEGDKLPLIVGVTIAAVVVVVLAAVVVFLFVIIWRVKRRKRDGGDERNRGDGNIQNPTYDGQAQLYIKSEVEFHFNQGSLK